MNGQLKERALLEPCGVVPPEHDQLHAAAQHARLPHPVSKRRNAGSLMMMWLHMQCPDMQCSADSVSAHATLKKKTNFKYVRPSWRRGRITCCHSPTWRPCSCAVDEEAVGQLVQFYNLRWYIKCKRLHYWLLTTGLRGVWQHHRTHVLHVGSHSLAHIRRSSYVVRWRLLTYLKHNIFYPCSRMTDPVGCLTHEALLFFSRTW
jgi:hypothetical protein